MKRKKWDTENTYIRITLHCSKCRANIGDVFRYAGQHPQAGEHRLEARVGDLRDRPDGGQTLHSRCTRCGATPETRWERISDQLDKLSPDGVSEMVLEV